MKIWISLCLLLLSVGGFAQDFDRIDRLNDSLKLDIRRDQRIRTLCFIAGELKKFDTEIARTYSDRALEIVDTNQQNEYVALYLKTSADIETLENHNDLALYHYSKAASIYDQLKMEHKLGKVYNNLAVAYRTNSDFDNSFLYAYKALKIKTKHDDHLGTTYLNLSSTFGMKASIMEQLELLDSSQYFALLALKTESSNSPYYGQVLSNAGLNLTNIYAMKGQIDSAFYWMNYTIDAFEKDSNKVDLITAYASRSYLYYRLQDYENALADARLVLSLTDSNQFDKTAYQMIHGSYWALGNCDSAYYFAAEFATKLHQKHAEDLSRNSAKYMSIFQNEKKQQQIQNLEKDKELKAIESAKKDEEIKNQQLTIAGVVGGLLLLSVLALVLIKRNNEKRKNNLALKSKNDLIQSQKDTLEERNNEIMDSIHYAKYIQESLLPAKKVVKSYLPESFILFKPKELVSGDFYWMHTEGDGLYVAVADCTGHGVPGAMVSVVGTNGLKRCLTELKLKKPSEILDHLASYVIDTFNAEGEREVKDGMDISLCKINFTTKTLEFAGANNPLWILRGEEIIQVKADRQPVGKHLNPVPFNNHEFELQVKDRLFMFSDGFADQFGGPKGKKLKSKTFKQLLIDNKDMDMESLHDLLNKTIEDWMGTLEQIDDISVMGIEV